MSNCSDGKCNCSKEKDDEILCSCLGVTYREVRDAIENGASSVDDVIAQTGAGSACGSCVPEIEKLINAH